MRSVLWAIVAALALLHFSPAHAGGLLQDLFAPAPRPSPIVYQYAPAQPHIRFQFDEGLRVSRRPHFARKAIGVSRSSKFGVSSKRAAIKFGGRSRMTVNRANASVWRIERHRAVHRVHRLADKRSKASVERFAALNPASAVPVAAAAAPPAKIHEDRTLRIGDAYMTTEGLRIYRGAAVKAGGQKAFVELRRSDIGAGAKARLAALVSGARADYAPLAIKPATKSTAASSRRGTSLDRNGRTIRVVGP